MKPMTFIFLYLINLSCTAQQPTSFRIQLHPSKLLATEYFVQQLSDQTPDNLYKKLFKKSSYNTPYYQNLIAQLDTLEINEQYFFPGYRKDQQQPFMIRSFIDKTWLQAASIDEWKRWIFGMIPSSEMKVLSRIIQEFLPVYETLLFAPHQQHIKTQFANLSYFMQTAKLPDYLQQGQVFYHSNWDSSIPIHIAVLPSLQEHGFQAKAFLNIAILELPLIMEQYDLVSSILMHEIFHSFYNEQSLDFKNKIKSWFNSTGSPNGQYAYLLLNEALATAAGNGYIFEQLNGKPDSTAWYSQKYINQMAQKIYPLVKSYFIHHQPIDSTFISKYQLTFDQYFSHWTHEMEFVLMNRFILTDDIDDSKFFLLNYPYCNYQFIQTSINEPHLNSIKEAPFTKIIIVSKHSKNNLALIKNSFTELKNWEYHAEQPFIFTTYLQDQTVLIIINKKTSNLKALFKKINFRRGKFRIEPNH